MASAMVHCGSAVCPGSGCDGRKQDDGLLMDQTEESGRNNLDCGRMSWGGRMLDESCGMVEQTVVASDRT